MGLFGRKRPQQVARRVEVTVLDGSCGDFQQHIVGEASYQAALREIDAGRSEKRGRVEFRVVLVPEPTNRYDRNAVQCRDEFERVLGYLSRDEARDLSPHLRRLLAESPPRVVGCMARLMGGHDGKMLGVVLDVDWRAAFVREGEDDDEDDEDGE